ncbi:hypothetical protein OEZ86_005309 [Tetradesmus obliquus]|nr:hypothetical protein OEZ86_005309 [Tetradesmus obliquus]
MCGTLLVAAAVDSEQQAPEYVQQCAAAFEAGLRARGPDHLGTKQVFVPAASSSTASAATRTLWFGRDWLDLPIDLSTVCFVGGASPDRLAAHSALLELAAFAPQRQWRLIEVNSSLEEVDQHAQHIRSLLHPAGTVMDLNIGAALWLAARAEGQRVLLPVCSSSDQPASNAAASSSNGSGEDSSSSSNGSNEQCGGYGRHRTRFRLGSWQGLADELAVDVKRLWIRNLGRDDRLVADHGREGRHPFLDEVLMAGLLGMPLQLLADLSKPPGTGDKVILRQALASLGLPLAAAREKRAIQFGSRIGKLSNMREFGSNRKANMMSAGQVHISKLPKSAAP